MPSHPDRVAKNYDGLCANCLSKPSRDYDPEMTYYWLCWDCFWKKFDSEHITTQPTT